MLIALTMCTISSVETLALFMILLVGGALIGAIGLAVAIRAIGHHLRAIDPYARPFGDQPNLMRAYNGGRKC